MIYNEEFLEIDPNKKDEVWANRLVTHFRTYWSNLVDPKVSRQNMEIILSRYDMTNVMKMFKDPKKMGMEFLPIAIMEKIRNILIGERVKAGVSVSLNAIDPTAESEREADKKLLKNRAEIEDLLSYLNGQIGLPPYNLANEKTKSGKSAFAGNVEMFDELGLDQSQPDQVSYFFKVWHRLLHEMRGQEVVNYFIEYNELKDNVNRWCDDLMGKKCIAGQSFVNEMSGAIEQKYIAPERVKLIPGKRDDGRDAVCLGYEDGMTVADVLKRYGNSFKYEQDILTLVNAVNYVNHQEINGIWDRDTRIWSGTQSKKGITVQLNDFLNFKVECGYIEWKTIDAASYKMGVDWHGNLKVYQKTLNSHEAEGSKYAKDVYYNEVTYRSFFIATSTNSQKLIKWGPLYHQVIEGAEDEYSNFSIFFKKIAGPTIAEVAHPWIEMAQESFTKFRWMVRKAKPKGRAYNYESLIAVAKKMINEGNDKARIGEVIKMFEEGVNEIFTIPKVDGERVGGGVNPNYELPNGLDGSALSFKEVIDWCVEMIKGDLGINEIREAYSPKPNDGFKLQMTSLEQSRNATNYMSEAIDSLLRQFAKHTLISVQDIVKYKDTVPYNFLKRAIGAKAIQDIAELEGVAFHRYGIFVNSFATYMERQRVLAETNEAWKKGEISYATKMLVDSIDDYRKAAFVMAFEKERAQKIKEKEEQMRHQYTLQIESQKHTNKMAEINLEGQLDIRAEQVRGYYYYQSSIAQANSRIEQTQMKIDNKDDEINLKAQAKIEEQRTKKSLDNQSAIV